MSLLFLQVKSKDLVVWNGFHAAMAQLIRFNVEKETEDPIKLTFLGLSSFCVTLVRFSIKNYVFALTFRKSLCLVLLKPAETSIYSVRCNFIGFQFLCRFQIIEYFVGGPFPFHCPCLITEYFCLGNIS